MAARTDKLFKLVDKRWQYYPLGTVIEDVYLIVKDGSKEKLEQSLDAEWNWVYPLIVLTVSLGLYRPLLMAVPFLIYMSYFFFRRSQIEKEFCDYRSYSRKKFFTSYPRVVYFFIDETNNDQFRGFFLMFIFWLTGALATYLNGDKSLMWVGAMALFSLLFLILFILICIKKSKVKAVNRSRPD